MFTLDYLFWGVTQEGHTYNNLVPFMRTAAVLNILSLPFLLIPKLRDNDNLLTFALVILFLFPVDRQGHRPGHRRFRADHVRNGYPVHPVLR